MGVNDGTSVGVSVAVEGRNGVGEMVGVRVTVKVGVTEGVTINGVQLAVGVRGVPVIVAVSVDVTVAVGVAVWRSLEEGASISAIPPTQ